MARLLNGTSESILTSAGAFAGGTFSYGTIAGVVRLDSVADYRTLIEAVGGAVGVQTGVSNGEIRTNYDAGAYSWSGGTNNLDTGVWFCMVLVKASGSAIPRLHLYDYSSSTWTHHVNLDTARANGTNTVTGWRIGRLQSAAFEYWQGAIAALGVYRAWVPDDTAVESAGLEGNASAWVSAEANADLAAVWVPGQTAASTPLVDLTGGGADETTSGQGTVVDPPAGFTETLGPAPQVLEPVADIAANSWTDQAGGTTALYATLDEAAASDADYAASPSGATSTAYLEVSLEAGADPSSSTDHKVRYRYGKVAGTGTTDLTVSLRQGATQIASWAHTGIAAGWTTVEQILTGGEADAITDYTDLRLRFAPTGAAAVTPAKVADRHASSHTTSVDPTTFALTGGTTVGNYLIMRVAPNNSGGGGTRPGLTVTDARGNTWTVTTGALQDPGAVNAGAVDYIAWCRITTAHITGDLVSLDWGTSPTVKSVVIEEWTGLAPTGQPAVAAVQANGAASPISVANTPTAAGQLVYAAAGLEGPAADAPPGAVSGWTALTRQASALGTVLDNMSVVGAYRLATGATAHTWNPTLTTARDWAAEAIVFAQDPGSKALVSWAQVELPAVPAATYVDIDDPLPAGLGFEAEPAAVSVTRSLAPTATGLGLGSVGITPSVALSLAPTATGIGLGSPTVALGVVRGLEGLPASFGLGSPTVALGVVRELEPLPAGIGLGSVGAIDVPAVYTTGGRIIQQAGAGGILTHSGDHLAYLGAPVGVLVDLDPAPAGIGLDAPAVALGVVRGLEPVGAGFGLGSPTVALGVVRTLAPVASGLGLDVLSAALGVVRTLAPSASGVGLDALALSALGVVRGLTPETSGFGLEALEATPSVARALALTPTGVGFGSVGDIFVGAEADLELAPAGLGLGASEGVLHLALALGPSPAGFGVGAPTVALGVVRGLTPVAAGIGLGNPTVALGVVRSVTPVASGMGFGATEGTVRLVLTLAPGPGSLGFHASEVDSLLDDVTLVLLDPARSGVGWGASEGTLSVLRSLTLAPSGVGLGDVAAELGVARSLTVGATGVGLGATAAPLGLIVPLGLVAAELGLGSLPAPIALMAVTVPPSWGSSIILVNPTPTDAEDLTGATRVVAGDSPTSVMP